MYLVLLRKVVADLWSVTDAMKRNVPANKKALMIFGRQGFLISTIFL